MPDLHKEAKPGLPGAQDIAPNFRKAHLPLFTALQQGAFRGLGKDRRKKLAEQQRAQGGEWTHSVHGEAMQGRGSHRNFLRCLLVR